MKKWILIAMLGMWSLSGLAQQELSLEYRAGLPGDGKACRCAGGGAVWQLGLEWTMASCAQRCLQGWGFDCGLVQLLYCSNGELLRCPLAGPCAATLPSLRQVEAGLQFFDDRTLRLTFRSALPADEQPGPFVVERDRTIPLPEGVWIGGRRYSAYRVLAGRYSFNLSDGRYGSLTVGMELVE